MDLSYGPEYEVFRAEVRQFLADEWHGSDGEADTAAFRDRATKAGYLYRSVPREYGGSGQEPDALRARVIREEFVRADAPLEHRTMGTEMVVPTLLDHGSDWQKARFIPPTIRDEITWCQGYSEPGAGSDLASLQTRAVLDGDSGSSTGRRCGPVTPTSPTSCSCLLARSPTRPSAAGISYLLVPMDQPGIEVRPLRQITGDCEFNEVFFTDATTPAAWIVGQRGDGWQVANTTLKHERGVGRRRPRTPNACSNSLIRLAQRTADGYGRPIDQAEVRQRLAEVQGMGRVAPLCRLCTAVPIAER